VSRLHCAVVINSLLARKGGGRRRRSGASRDSRNAARPRGKGSEGRNRPWAEMRARGGDETLLPGLAPGRPRNESQIVQEWKCRLANGPGKNPIRHHVRQTLHQSLIENRPRPRSPLAGRRAPWSQGKCGVHKGRRIGLGARSSPIHARLPKCKMFGPPGRGPIVLENFDEDNTGCDEPRRARRPFAAWRDGPVRGIARARTGRAGRNSACRRRRLLQPTPAPQPQRPQGEGAGGSRTYAHDAPRPRPQKLTGQLPSPRRRRATFDDQPRFPGRCGARRISYPRRLRWPGRKA